MIPADAHRGIIDSFLPLMQRIPSETELQAEKLQKQADRRKATSHFDAEACKNRQMKPQQAMNALCSPRQPPGSFTKTARSRQNTDARFSGRVWRANSLFIWLSGWRELLGKSCEKGPPVIFLTAQHTFSAVEPAERLAPLSTEICLQRRRCE